MNYAHLAVWIRGAVDELVAIGIPRTDAEALCKALEYGAVRAYADAKNEAQFLLDFDRLGTEVLARRKGVTQQAIRKMRTRYLQRKQPGVAPSFASGA